MLQKETKKWSLFNSLKVNEIHKSPFLKQKPLEILNLTQIMHLHKK